MSLQFNSSNMSLSWYMGRTTDSSLDKEQGIRAGSGIRQSRDLPVSGKKLVIGRPFNKRYSNEWGTKKVVSSWHLIDVTQCLNYQHKIDHSVLWIWHSDPVNFILKINKFLMKRHLPRGIEINKSINKFRQKKFLCFVVICC